MFQPVGGMDQIAKAFEIESRRTHPLSERGAGNPADGGRRRAAGGHAICSKDRRGRFSATFCLCTIPLSVLRDIPSDFAPAMSDAIRQVPYMEVGKIGLQFKRRFWEEDDRIYGGISWTDAKHHAAFLSQLPATWASTAALMIGYYHFGKDAEEVGKLTPSEREEHALAAG